MRRHILRPNYIPLIGAAIVVVAIFIGTGIFLYREYTEQAIARATAESKIASLKQRGIPTDIASLNAFYHSRTNANDAAAWLRIYQQLKSEEFNRQCGGISILSFRGMSERTLDRKTQLDIIRKLIHQYADTLAEIHILASHAQAVQFGDRYTQESIEFISVFRDVMAFLGCETSVHIANRNSASTYQSLKSQIGTIQIMSGGDLIVDHLINSMLQTTMIEDVRNVLEQNVLTKEDLALLLDDLKKMPGSVQNWPQIVDSERACVLPYLRGHEIAAKTNAEGKRIWDVNQTNGKDLLNYLNYMERYGSVNWTSWKSARANLAAIENDLQEDVASATFWDEHNWRSTKTVFPNWGPLAEKLAKNVSNRNHAILACAARLYKLTHGSFPDRLDQLVDVGIDPTKFLSMADLPFGYAVQDGTAFLWGPISEGLKFPFGNSPSVQKLDSSTRPNDQRRKIHEGFEFPFSISPSVPKIDSSTKPENQENIKQALWKLDP